MKNDLLHIFLFVILLFLGGISTYAQNTNTSCDSALPACPDQNFGVNIPSEVGGGNAPMGPDYGCLITQPRPLWYYMQISQTGIVEFVLTQFSQPDQQGTPIDVDYIIWGPFETPDGNCNDLTAENIVDCSYHGAATEYIDFNTATAGPTPGPNPGSANSGEYYLLMITNYGGSSGYINLQPTEQMSAEFNCAILGESYGVCDEGADGTETISLAEYAELIGADEAGNVLSFHLSNQEAVDNANALPDDFILNDRQTTLYVRLQQPGRDTIKIVFVLFTLEEIPVLGPAVLTECDDGNDGSDIFNLLDAATQMSDDAQLNYTFHLTQEEAQAGTGQLENPWSYASGETTLFVRGSSAHCFGVTTLQLNLQTIEERSQQEVYFCSPPQGAGQVDLNSYNALFMQDGDSHSEFFSSQNNLNQGEAIPNPSAYMLEPGVHNVWVRIYHGACYDAAQLQITVMATPFAEPEEIFICPEEFPYVLTHLNPENYDLEWIQNGETTEEISVTDYGEYVVRMTNVAECSGVKRYIISPREGIQNLTLTVTGSSTVVAEVSGNMSDMEFSLDEGPWQSSPVFENVSAGFHSVRAKYLNGCVSEPATNYVVQLFNVLTPNGDGLNDRLEFPDIEQLPGVSIEIYNRYGKLIHSHTADKPFIWDGTYHGRPLPSGSYWYLVQMPDGRQIRSHITIKHF